MAGKEQIGARQLSVLVIFFVIGDMLLFLPSNAAMYSKQDTWIAALIGLSVGAVFAWLIYRISLLFPGLTLVEFNKLALGKWAGGAVTIVYLFFFLTNLTVEIREIGDFVTAQMMTETPMRVINLLMVIVVMLAVRNGLETISRTSEIFFILFIILFASIVILLMPQSDPNKLQPMLGQGALHITQGALYFVSFPFTELVVFWMILPKIRQRKHTQREYMLGILFAASAIFSVTLISVLVLGPFLLTNQIYATYTLAKKINIAHFLERVEAILAINWILSTYIRSTINGYAFLTGFAQLLGIRDYRILTFPLGMLLFGYAFIISPNIAFFNSTNPYWVSWDFTLFPVIPLLIVGIYAMKKKLRGAGKHP